MAFTTISSFIKRRARGVLLAVVLLVVTPAFNSPGWRCLLFYAAALNQPPPFTALHRGAFGHSTPCSLWISYPGASLLSSITPMPGRVRTQDAIPLLSTAGEGAEVAKVEDPKSLLNVDKVKSAMPLRPHPPMGVEPPKDAAARYMFWMNDKESERNGKKGRVNDVDNFMSVRADEEADGKDNDFVSPDIVKGVPIDTIKGAMVTSVTAALVLSKSVPVSAAAALTAGMLSIVRGGAGDATRVLGELTVRTSRGAMEFWKVANEDGFFQRLAGKALDYVLMNSNGLKSKHHENISLHLYQNDDEDDDLMRVLREAAEAEREAELAAKELAKAEEEARAAWELAREAEEARKQEEVRAEAKLEEMLRKEREQEEEKLLAAQIDAERQEEREALARRATEEEKRRAADIEARRKAEEEALARRTAEEEKRRTAEIEAKRKLEEEKRRSAEAEAKRKAEEQEALARREAEEEKQRKEGEAKEVERKRREEEKARIRAAEEERRRKEEEEAIADAKRRRREEIDAKRMRAEEERRRKEEEEAKRRRAEEEERRREEEEIQAKRKAEQEEAMRLEEEEEDKRKAEEEEEESRLKEWNASVRLAKQLDGINNEAASNEDNPQWDAAQTFAGSSLAEEEDAVLDLEDEVDETSLPQDELARMAREAVAKYEAQLQEQEESDRKIKFGKSLRRRVKNQNLQNGAVSPDTVNNWGSMTVVQLKDALRSRGLKVSGRKAELIERLQDAA